MHPSDSATGSARTTSSHASTHAFEVPRATESTTPLRWGELSLAVRLGLLSMLVVLCAAALFGANSRLQASTVHDPVSVAQVRYALADASWQESTLPGEVRHPALQRAGTRLTLLDGSLIDVFVFQTNAVRVAAEQHVVQWNRTLSSVHDAADSVVVRVTSVENALFVITGADTATVQALNNVVAGLARA